jgi:hypothetical protein
LHSAEQTSAHSARSIVKTRGFIVQRTMTPFGVRYGNATAARVVCSRILMHIFFRAFPLLHTST